MLKRLILDYKRYMVLMILSIILALISTAFSLVVPVLMGQGMDLLVYKEVDFDNLMLILRKMTVSVLISALLSWIMNHINNKIVYGLSSDLRKRAFSGFVNSRIKFLDEHSEGDIISRIIVDCDGICDGLLLGFNQFFTGIVTIIITLVFMIWINVYLALAVVVLTPLSLFVAKFITSRSNIHFANQAKVRGEIFGLSSDIINMKEIINYEGAEEYFAKRFDESNISNERASRKAIFFSSLSNPLTRLVNAICYAFVTLLGSSLAIMGFISIGSLTSFLAYATSYAKPFNDISSVLSELQNSIVCLDRVYEVIDARAENRASLNSDDVTGDMADYSIKFQNVIFSYDNDNDTKKPILNDVTFTIPSGQKLGIVGASGSGKTTIMKLLLKYYDYNKGHITIGGVELNDMPVDNIRSVMGLMLQEPYLIRGSVLDNIKMGNPTVSREDVIAAAKECYAHNFIINLPQGYDTIVTKENLSIGQRQLICITRLMIRDSKVVLLDEATSSIDVLNEQLIQEAFVKIMADKTTIVVAHRLSTIRDSDMIIVVDAGAIKEMGTHEELLLKRGYYYRLYSAQSLD